VFKKKAKSSDTGRAKRKKNSRGRNGGRRGPYLIDILAILPGLLDRLVVIPKSTSIQWIGMQKGLRRASTGLLGFVRQA
jgi:hypothetical protein